MVFLARAYRFMSGIGGSLKHELIVYELVFNGILSTSLSFMVGTIGIISTTLSIMIGNIGILSTVIAL